MNLLKCQVIFIPRCGTQFTNPRVSTLIARRTWEPRSAYVESYWQSNFCSALLLHSPEYHWTACTTCLSLNSFLIAFDEPSRPLLARRHFGAPCTAIQTEAVHKTQGMACPKCSLNFTEDPLPQSQCFAVSLLWHCFILHIWSYTHFAEL